jgi:ATP-dependent helicase HrpA
VSDSPWVRDDIVSWDFGDLPDSIEVRRAGMTLLGYPALVDNGTCKSVSMRLFDTPEAAHASHRAGVRRMFLIQMGEELKHLSRTLSGFDRMALNFSTIGSGDELRAQLMDAIADRAFGDAGHIRTQADFTDRAGAAWRQLTAARNEVCAAVDQTLVAYQQLAKQLSGPLPPLWEPAARDVKEQMAHLLPKDFVTRTPVEWLPHLPRFIKAAQVRMQKLGRDAQRMAELAPLWEQYLARAKKHKAEGVVDPALEQYRWMLEEFRVSLFAQELKTSIPVSATRLEAQWALVKP